MTTGPLLLRKFRPRYTSIYKTRHLNNTQEKTEGILCPLVFFPSSSYDPLMSASWSILPLLQDPDYATLVLKRLYNTTLNAQS